MGKILLTSQRGNEGVPYEYTNPSNTFSGYRPYDKDNNISVKDFINLVDKYTIQQDGDELILLDADNDYFNTDIAIATFGGFCYHERHYRSRNTLVNVGGGRRGYLELEFHEGNLTPNNVGQSIPFIGYSYLNLYFRGGYSRTSSLYMDYNYVGVTNDYFDLVSTKKRTRDGNELVRARIPMTASQPLTRISFYKYNNNSSAPLLYRITFSNQREEA